MKTTKETIIIAKYTLKSNGAVIFRMRSNVPNKHGCVRGRDMVCRDGQWYDVYTVTSDGETVCGCHTGDGNEQCKGSQYRGTCPHRKHAQSLLDAKRVVVMPAQPAKVTDISTRGNLNGNRGFHFMRAG